MIQRIQTLYLAIAIIFLSLVTVGFELFAYVSETTRYVFTSYGISQYDIETGKLVEQQNFPFYIGTAALALLCFLTIMAYKDLNRQFKLGRMTFFTYFMLLFSVFMLSMVGDGLIDDEIIKRELDLGYFLFILGFPFTFLANTGIKRDKNLLDSLDRLR